MPNDKAARAGAEDPYGIRKNWWLFRPLCRFLSVCFKISGETLGPQRIDIREDIGYDLAEVRQNRNDIDFFEGQDNKFKGRTTVITTNLWILDLKVPNVVKSLNLLQ